MLKPPVSIFFSSFRYFLSLIPINAFLLYSWVTKKHKNQWFGFWWCQWQLLCWWRMCACNEINIRVTVVKTGLSGDQTLLTGGRIYEKLTSSLTATTGGRMGGLLVGLMVVVGLAFM